MEGGNVYVEGVWLVEAPGDPLRPQPWHEPKDLVAINEDRPGTDRIAFSRNRAQVIESCLIGDPEEAAIRENRGVDRAIRRGFQEGSAGLPERA